MKIVRLQVEGFKRLVAVDITPSGDLIEIHGKNGHGKTSVLDAISAALEGASAAPVEPIHDGEEMSIIRLDLGELIVTRYFNDDGTTRLKVENGKGATFTSAQTMLDKLVGHISFDPLEFARRKPEEQADELRKLVDIGIDLDAIAKAEADAYSRRRDINRDGKALRVQLDALPDYSKELPETLPDKNALLAKLSSAADHNSAIANEVNRREQKGDALRARRESVEEIQAQIKELQSKLEVGETTVKNLEQEIAEFKPLEAEISTEAVSNELRDAEAVLEKAASNERRQAMLKDFAALKWASNWLSNMIALADETRANALSSAKMPVEGLSLEVADDQKIAVKFNGYPFSQASGAEQLRVSIAVAMAANPELRVIRVKDASLLDEDSLKIMREMATAHDFQIWAEMVGDGDGVGIIMDDGKVRGAPDPEPLDKPKRRAKKAESADDGVQGSVEGEPTGQPPEPADKSLFDRPQASTPQKTVEQAERPKPRAMTEFTTKPKE